MVSTAFARTAPLACLLLSLAPSTLSCASSPAQAPEPTASASREVAVTPGVPGGVIVETSRLRASVVGIDHATRRVTLVGPDGIERTVTAGPAAVNFDRIEVGDMVNVTLTRELVVAMEGEQGAGSDGSAAVVALAPVGAKPGGVVAGTTRVTGTVTAIDPVERTATLRFADGTTRTYPVRDDIDLGQRRLGEKVVFQVTEALAIDISKE